MRRLDLCLETCDDCALMLLVALCAVLTRIVFMGCSQNLRQQILELLGPISMNHGAHFMAAIAYVWNERKQAKTSSRNKVGATPEVSDSFCTLTLQIKQITSVCLCFR